MVTVLIAWLIVNLFTVVLLAGFGSALKRQPLDLLWRDTQDRLVAFARRGGIGKLRGAVSLTLLLDTCNAPHFGRVIPPEASLRARARHGRPSDGHTPPRTRTPRR